MEKSLKDNSYIFGRRNIIEILKKNGKNFDFFPFQEIYIKASIKEDLKKEVISKIPQDVKILFKEQSFLDALLPGKNHQGIIALKAKIFEKSLLKSFDSLKEKIEKKTCTLLILDRIQDVGNLGNIIRTAECFGIVHLLLTERESASVNSTVEKISAGAIHHINIYTIKNLHNTIRYLKEIGYWIVSTTDKGNEDWSVLPEKETLAIIIGNEEKGVKNIALENSDYLLRIPMKGEVSSLNVATSCGIILDRIMNR